MSAKRFLTGLIALIMAFCLLPEGAARADGPENGGNTVAAVAVEENVQATFAGREQSPMINAPQATAGPAEAEATEQSSVQIRIARGLGVLMAVAVILVMQRKKKSVYRKRK